MSHRKNLAVIGSGASSIYLLKHLLDEAELLKNHFDGISIFEKSSLTGMGMPYSPLTTDRYNISNISSEELPELLVSLGDWLRGQPRAVLKALHLENLPISDSEVYSRLALGQYLNAQYRGIVAKLDAAGITITEYPGCEIVDVRDEPVEDRVRLRTERGDFLTFSKVVIATGHYWTADDKPEEGYYASPWPISKLLPDGGTHHDFEIGTLGASLSAFDVIASLANRHGEFVPGESGGLKFNPHPGTEKFKIVMHSVNGLLPHLQFDQDKPRREIYRHVSREELLEMVDADGFLRIETYFDRVCRPALLKAFRADAMPEMVTLMEKSDFALADFVERMTASHDYPDAFEGMRMEMTEAEESVLHHRPIHWKEVVDDLMYTLNFHAELMPAEDHLLLHSLMMPFLLNVVAAMPLRSGDTILALHDTGKLELVSGKVTREDGDPGSGTTTVKIDDAGKISTRSYRMFVDCSGQKPLQLEDYPFPSLVRDGMVRKARAPFTDSEAVHNTVPKEKKALLFQENGKDYYSIGGVDIDGTCRLVGEDGKPNPRIYDIAFPHTTGIRPYSYGLQACSHTSAILVKALVEEIQGDLSPEAPVEEVTRIFETISP